MNRVTFTEKGIAVIPNLKNSLSALTQPDESPDEHCTRGASPHFLELSRSLNRLLPARRVLPAPAAKEKN